MSFFGWPSIETTEELATKPLPQRGDDTKITIYGFEAAGNYPSYHRGNVDSPYVARVEAYLRLHKIKYEKLGAKHGDNSPRNKLPFANIRGTMVDDSSRIIEFMKKDFHLVDDEPELSPKQHAQGRMMRHLLFGSLYFVQLHHMFETQEGRDVFCTYKRKTLPPYPISELILKFILDTQRANLQGTGIGRQSHIEIVQRGQDDLRALSTMLGEIDNNETIFGTEKPTVYDCDLYAFLAFTFWDDTMVVHSWVDEIQIELPNLVKYTKRMRDLLYPELKEQHEDNE